MPTWVLTALLELSFSVLILYVIFTVEYRPAKNKGKVALPAEAPLVSILKPLRAMDDDLQCNLES